jgi:DNA-binding response OmpR family regulator
MPTPSNLSAAAPQILVIDDSPTIRKIMEVCHTREHISIQTFTDGIEALRWFTEHPTLLPSLIYLDIEMPRMDGFEVARRLHSKSALVGIPILMFSSRDKVIDRLKGRLAGAKGYVTKPFREQDVIALTRSYLWPEESGAVAK